MREAFKKEENGGLDQTNDASQFERDLTQPVDISNSALNRHNLSSQTYNQSGAPDFVPLQINVEPEYYAQPSPRFDTRVQAHDE